MLNKNVACGLFAMGAHDENEIMIESQKFKKRRQKNCDTQK